MKQYYTIIIGLIIFSFHNGFSQSREIFPDYIDYGINEKASTIKFIDIETDSIRRIVYFDSIGRITKEMFINYKPISGKFKIYGTFTYKYSDLIYPFERFYTNKREDTLKVVFDYSLNGLLRKKINWEFERKSKLRKGAPDYYDGSPYGCIPAEEDIIRYREWTIREKKRFKYKKGNLTKINVPYEWKMQPRNWLLNYNKNSILTERKEYTKKHRTLNWVEHYKYSGDSTIVTKEYFVTYWNKIPPIETQTIITEDSKINSIRTEYGNSQTYKLIEFKHSNGQLIEITKTTNNKIEFTYKIEYE